MGHRAARAGHPGRTTNRDTPGLKYLLSGICFCGLCGDVMRTIKNKGIRSYNCRGCHGPGIKVSTLDDYVGRVVIARLMEPDAIELLAAQDDAVKDRTAQARARAAELMERLETFYASAAVGELSASALAAIEKRLLPEIEQANNAVTGLTLPPVIRNVVGANAGDAWEALSMRERRELVSALAEVYLDPTGAGRRIFDPRRVRVEWKTL